MLKYLIVLLDDTSPSFCHYANNKTERKLIALDFLKQGIIWAMKENLMIQFVYPNYELPKEYLELIDSVDHIDIEEDNADADVSVFEGVESFPKLRNKQYPRVVLRLSRNEIFDNVNSLQEILTFQQALIIVVTDIPSFSRDDYDNYSVVLKKLSDTVIDKIKDNMPVSLNLLTDRLLLSSMNNCNAGDENITLGPDGNFYICPAYYLEGEDDVGNPVSGIRITNRHLYNLERAPICRKCDAYQCKRCVWLNQKTTLEVNTPSHEQCVVAHLERNASRHLLETIKGLGLLKTDHSIPEIGYLDPFDKVKR